MSQLPSDLPQLPKWPFLCADLVLLSTAAAVTWGTTGPLGGGALVTVMFLVALAGILCAIPFVTDYARSQDQSLDERQRSLEALAKSVANSSEQLGIAVQSLSRRDVPQTDPSVEKLTQAIEALSRMQETAQTQAERAQARLSAMESSANQSSARFSAAMEQALSRSSESLAASLLSVRSAMDTLIADSQARISSQVESRLAESKAAIAASSAASCAQLEEIGTRLDARISASLNLLEEKAAALVLIAERSTSLVSSATSIALAPSSAPVVAESAPLVADVQPRPEPMEAVAPMPTIATPSPEVLPVSVETLTPGRQTRRKPEPVPEAQVMDLFNEHFSLDESHSTEPLVSRSVSADGATRLNITAYIGIGNKLFIRGDGPGLSWERGIPLQFVSIGKWRWETLEAEASFRFRLFKNDSIECAALGEQVIDAGQQLEATAAF